MKQVMRYLANDGELFDTIKKCEDYEDRLKMDFELDSKIKELEGIVGPYLDTLDNVDMDDFYNTDFAHVSHGLDGILKVIAEHLCN